MKTQNTFNLLTVMGKVKPTSVAATCELHNQTAGHPDGVVAAKALGDISHMVYMPIDAAKNFSGDLLFLDIWDSVEGMQQFFSDAQVQAGAGMMFNEREAVVWNKLTTFFNFQFPAPFGKNDRFVAIVRGTVKSFEEAEKVHNGMIEKHVKTARANGILSHEFYARMAALGSPEALEVIGIDIWMDADGMMKHYTSPEFQQGGLYEMFSGKPQTSVWVHPQGTWVEW